MSKTTRYGLQTWTLEALPADRREQMLAAQYVKPWKTCRQCGSSPARQYCSGCGGYDCNDKYRYCGIECQRKNWSIHKQRCSLHVLVDRRIKEATPSQLAKWICMEYRQALRWEHAWEVSYLLNWVVRQAFCWLNSSIITEDYCLCIEMRKLVPDRLFSPLIPALFEIRPPNWTRDGPPSPSHKKTRRRAKYAVKVQGWPVARGDVYFADLDEDTVLSTQCPQWPWIFAHCVAMGDIEPTIAGTRLDTLIVSARKMSQTIEPFNHFIAPQLTSKLEFSKQELDKWMEVAYPLVSVFRSRFHPPCNVVSELYGHLT